jgi:hypothetical protein
MARAASNDAKDLSDGSDTSAAAMRGFSSKAPSS